MARRQRDHRAEWARRNQLARERGYANASAEKRARAADREKRARAADRGRQRDYRAEEARRNQRARELGFASRAEQRRAIKAGEAVAGKPRAVYRLSNDATIIEIGGAADGDGLDGQDVDLAVSELQRLPAGHMVRCWVTLSDGAVTWEQEMWSGGRTVRNVIKRGVDAGDLGQFIEDESDKIGGSAEPQRGSVVGAQLVVTPT